MKLSDKLKQHKDLIDDKLRGLYKIHEGPAGGLVFMQHDDGTYVECWIQDESKKMNWDYAREHVKKIDHGRYNDWSLPTKDELDSMYDNKDRIGNFHPAFYWSDTEFSGLSAWLRSFSSGIPNYTGKSLNSRVRVIRRFK